MPHPVFAASFASFPPATAVVLSCTALVVLVASLGIWQARGTTLIGPLGWVIAAAAAVGTVECLTALGWLGEASDAWRFAAAVGVFSPWMSLLGAKRPQDNAWHFIVGSLWGVQAMPAAEVIFLRPGQTLAIIDFRAYFLIVLIGLSLLVHLPTRYWLAGLIAIAGQVALLWDYLPFSADRTPGNEVAIACALFALSAVVASIIAWRARVVRPFDRLWCDFRDAFGALWAARVMERVNASATMQSWTFQLGWSGFHAADDPLRAVDIPPEKRAELRQVMRNLLRRFVSDAWIETRLRDAGDSTASNVEH